MEKELETLPAGGSRFSRLPHIFIVALGLGLTSFGGPVAHLGYFHNEYVRRRRWLDEPGYADLVALCQFLPGPASSQVGIGIGILRAGLAGGLMAWLGFTLPSVVLLTLFALLMRSFDMAGAGWVHGLKIVAVAIVAQAIVDMGRKLAPDRGRATIAVAAAAAALLWPYAAVQVGLIAAAAAIGMLAYRNASPPEAPEWTVPVGRRTAAVLLAAFAGLLALLPVAAGVIGGEWLSLFDSFYRAGSLVFGGGHVVLPLLEREVVPAGWVSPQDFLAGYGAAQAVPGPLFTFAAYLGAIFGGVGGAAVATAAMFLPAFLLVAGALPFWSALRGRRGARGALMGVNAAVVGILLAAFYNPLWVSAIGSGEDFVLGAVLFLLLVFWKLPPWVVVLAGAAGGMIGL